MTGLRKGARRLKIAKRSSYFSGYFISLRSGNNWRLVANIVNMLDYHRTPSQVKNSFHHEYFEEQSQIKSTTAVTNTQWSETFLVSKSSILIHWKNIDVENIFLYFTKKSHEDYWFNKLYLKKIHC